MNEPAAPERTPEERLVAIGGMAADDPRFAPFAADFKAHLLTAPPRAGDIRPADAWPILSALQLALAHPHFPASIRPVVETFARQLQALVSVTPTLAEVAEAGWRRDRHILVPITTPASDMLGPLSAHLTEHDWAHRLASTSDASALATLVGEWSLATFGAGERFEGHVRHLWREMDELERAIAARDREAIAKEAADVAILLMGLAARAGFDLVAAVRAKMKRNFSRRWGAADREGVIEHLREHAASTARCPTCGAPLVPVVYPGGVWSEEQWASVRCGDWYCPTCPANGRGHPALCYWWQREVVR